MKATPRETFNKAQLAEIFGESISTVNKWVRDGVPCVRSGAIRSPLLFDSAHVLDWLIERDAAKHSPQAAEFARLNNQVRRLEFDASERGA